MRLADVSIKRPVFISVIIIAFTILGILSYKALSINDMPEVDAPYVTITISQNGATPEELENKVTKRVEEVVGQISGVEHINSTMSNGFSVTSIQFSLDKSVDVASQEVRDKISAIRGELPQDIDEPIIAKFDMGADPIVSIAISGDVDNKQLSKFSDDITKKLSAIKGVGVVNAYGKDEREIQIKLDSDKLTAYGMTTAEVVNGIRSDNIEMPGGKVSNGDREISLTTNSNVKNIEDFNNILVGKRLDTEIRLKDVAKVYDGVKEKDSVSYYKGNQAIGIDIVKQSGSNTVQVADDVNKEIVKMKESLPEGVNIDIVRDNSVSIRDTVNEVMNTILEGCILAVVIVFLFLNKWESTLISAISLPISIISTFICMKLMHFTLNTMSLMALSLAVGLLIDDAIVVIENIVRHLQMGLSPMQAAKEATSEIGFAVIATTLAVVSVFFPIALVSGMIGKYFIEFGLTVVFSMLVSLFISFTLVPMMASKMLKGDRKERKTIVGTFLKGFNNKFDKLAQKYSQFLAVTLKHRFITLAIAMVMFIGSLTLIPLLGFSFMPSTDDNEINLSANLDSGLSLETAALETKDIEEIISSYKEVKYMYSTVKNDSVSVYVKLIDKSQRKDGVKVIIDKMRADLNKLSGIEFAINGSSMGPDVSKDTSFSITGDNYEELQEVAVKVKQMLLKDPHARDVSISYKTGKPETKIEVDRDNAIDLGVNSGAVAEEINTLFNGTIVSKFDSGKDRYDVRVSIDDDQRKNLDSLGGIYVTGSNNKLIPLDQVTKKVFSTESSSLNRYDKTEQIQVSLNVAGISGDDFAESFLEKLKNEIQIPSGVSISIGGQGPDMSEGFTSLVMALVMSILFLYLVMAAQFESFIDPIAIMSALPLAVIGAIVGLLIFGSEFSVMAMIGIIMLMGLVAKNGILLIDAAKQKLVQGLPMNEALKEAGLIRLRPIMMTSLAMIVGMIPLALGTGAGTEMRAPMAQAVIGGLITSTILTLFVVPIIYTLLGDLKKFFKRAYTKKLSKNNKIQV